MTRWGMGRGGEREDKMMIPTTHDLSTRNNATSLSESGRLDCLNVWGGRGHKPRNIEQNLIDIQHQFRNGKSFDSQSGSHNTVYTPPAGHNHLLLLPRTRYSDDAFFSHTFKFAQACQ